MLWHFTSSQYNSEALVITPVTREEGEARISGAFFKIRQLEVPDRYSVVDASFAKILESARVVEIFDEGVHWIHSFDSARSHILL